MDAPSVRETIKTYGISAIAKTMGIGVSTINDWKDADAIPGKDGQKELRVRAFWAAVKKLDRKAKKSQARCDAIARSFKPQREAA